MCENEKKSELEPEPWKKNDGAGAESTFMKPRAPERELRHFYDDSAVLK